MMTNRKGLYQKYVEQGERDAYLKTLKRISKISSPDPVRFASGVNAAFQAGEDAAYEKAMEQFNGNISSDKTMEEENAIHKAEVDGEIEAYQKAMIKFHGVSNVPLNSPMAPSNYYEAHLMNRGYRFKTSVKGRFIQQNWTTLNDRMMTVYNDRLNMRWDDFVNAAMSFYLFAREFHEDINKNKFSGAIAKLQKVQKDWPSQISLVSGPRLLTRSNPQTGVMEAKPAGTDSAWEPFQKIATNYLDYRPDRKVEILSDALEVFPDTKLPVYSNLDNKGSLTDLNDVQKWLEENIIEPIGDVAREIQSVQDLVEDRSQLYNDLVELKSLLDEIVDEMDPDNVEESGKLPDKSKIKDLIRVVEGIAREIPNDDLKEHLENIADILDDSAYVTSKNPLIGGLARLSPWFFKNKDKISRSIRYLVKEYDSIWRIIHSGSHLI